MRWEAQRSLSLSPSLSLSEAQSFLSLSLSLSLPVSHLTKGLCPGDSEGDRKLRSMCLDCSPVFVRAWSVCVCVCVCVCVYIYFASHKTSSLSLSLSIYIYMLSHKHFTLTHTYTHTRTHTHTSMWSLPCCESKADSLPLSLSVSPSVNTCIHVFLYALYRVGSSSECVLYMECVLSLYRVGSSGGQSRRSLREGEGARESL